MENKKTVTEIFKVALILFAITAIAAAILAGVNNITAPVIEIPGKEGLNKNEYRVEAGTKVNVKDVMATATDNYDNDVEVEIVKADFVAAKEILFFTVVLFLDILTEVNGKGKAVAARIFRN